MRVAELIRVELEKAHSIARGPWTLAVAPDVHDMLCEELEVPFLDSLHGEHLKVALLDHPDLVVLMPSVPPHIYPAEEALALSRFRQASRLRRLYIPSARLTTPAAVEAYQALRSDLMEPDRAEELVLLL